MAQQIRPPANSLALAGMARAATAPRGRPAQAPYGTTVPAKRLSRLSRWFDNWRARRRLWRIAAIDPRFASDIGLSIADIEFECSAPFWVDLPRGGLPDDAKEG